MKFYIIALIITLSITCTNASTQTWIYNGTTPLSPLTWVTSWEGVAYDDIYFYFTSKDCLTKTDKHLNHLETLWRFIPQSYRQYGYNHMGDLDVFNKTMYIPVERESTLTNAIFMMVDCEFMDIKGFVNTTQDHAPWLAIDRENWLLYSSEYDNVDYVYAYDLDNYELQYQMKLVNVSLDGVQGGVVYKGDLYLSSNDDYIYRFKINGQEAYLSETIYTTLYGEVEGLCTADMEQGQLHMTNSIHFPWNASPHGFYHFAEIL